MCEEDKEIVEANKLWICHYLHFVLTVYSTSELPKCVLQNVRQKRNVFWLVSCRFAFIVIAHVNAENFLFNQGN